MIPQNKTFARNARINEPRGARDPNQDTLDGRSAEMEKSVQESRSPKPQARDGFAYRIKVKNTAEKVAEIVFWEYQFHDADNPNLVARRQFLCGVDIRPDKEKELEGFSLSGPSDVVSIGALADKSQFQRKRSRSIASNTPTVRSGRGKAGTRRSEGKLRSRAARTVGARTVQGPVNTNAWIHCNLRKQNSSSSTTNGRSEACSSICWALSIDCSEAGSAEEALTALSQETFDLVISDIDMGGMSGLELVPRVHSLAPDTVVVMISGNQDIEFAIKALRVGAFDYITKPIDHPPRRSFGRTRAETQRPAERETSLQRTDRKPATATDRAKSIGLLTTTPLRNFRIARCLKIG